MLDIVIAFGCVIAMPLDNGVLFVFLSVIGAFDIFQVGGGRLLFGVRVMDAAGGEAAMGVLCLRFFIKIILFPVMCFSFRGRNVADFFCGTASFVPKPIRSIAVQGKHQM